jgi:membrane protein DedA with SNARE-associated domain
MPDLLQTLLHYYAEYGYGVLLAAVLLENAGVPVPGETALLAAGYLASPDGGHRLHLWAVVAVAAGAAVVGDNIGYWLGRTLARPRLARGRRFLFLTPRRLEMAERYFHKYGAETVFFARFIAGLRIIGGPAAGAAGMHWPKFFAANAAGAVVWSVVITWLGYLFGHVWPALQKWLGRGSWVLVGVVVLGVAGWHLRKWLRQRRQTPTPGAEPHPGV